MIGGADGVRLVPEYRAGAIAVTATGVLDLVSYPALRDGLLKIATEAPEGLIADIDGVRVDDQTMMSVFSVVAMRISDWPGVPFALVTGRPEHRVALAARSVDRFVQVYEDFGTAESSLAHPSRRRAVQALTHSDASSGLARRFIKRVCDVWSVPEFTDDALLIGTELVENAIRHTVSAPTLRLELRRGILTVAVADDDPAPAVLLERVSALEPGLGLRMVAQTARVWGCNRTWSGGKVVWAVLTRRGVRRRPFGGE